MANIVFSKCEDRNAILELEREWEMSLNFPNDDFWDYQLSRSDYWVIRDREEVIAFACIAEEETLQQFYIKPKYLARGREVFAAFVKERGLKRVEVGTNNPYYLSLAMHFAKSSKVEGYIFKDLQELVLEEKQGDFRQAEIKDLDRLADFSVQALGADREWLSNYIEWWIKRGEFFFLEIDEEIIGTCEVRTGQLHEHNLEKEFAGRKVASLGIVISEQHRRKGYGTYLMGKAKQVARDRNYEPICSCDKDNIGSVKAIEGSGFRVLHLFLVLELDHELPSPPSS